MSSKYISLDPEWICSLCSWPVLDVRRRFVDTKSGENVCFWCSFTGPEGVPWGLSVSEGAYLDDLELLDES